MWFRELSWCRSESSRCSESQVLENRELSRSAKVVVYNAPAVPTLTYGAESWVLKGGGNAEGSGSGGESAKESTAVSSMDHVNNEVIREPAGAIRNSGEGMQKERIEDKGGGEKRSITVVV